MRSNGVANFPSPEVSGSSVSLQLNPSIAQNPRFKKAQQACNGLLPRGGPQGQVITAQDQADYLRAADCMRSHGIVGFPDPVFSGSEVHFPLPDGMDANSTQFLRAREICEQLIPNGPPYSKEAEGGQ